VRRGLWASLPPAARAVLVQLLIAVALYALFRARRVGRAVPEARLSPIPAGELVAATGRLLRAAKDPAYAATAIAAHATRDIDAPLGDISDTAASVHDDETLIAAAATIESAARRIREEGE
jgi:hypothetical protein